MFVKCTPNYSRRSESMSTFAPNTGPVSQEVNDEVCRAFERLADNLPSGEYPVEAIATKLALPEALIYCTVARELIRLEGTWPKKMRAAGVSYWRGVISKR